MVVSDTIVRGVTCGGVCAVHSSEPPSSTESPINFNTNTGSGLSRAFAAITHEVMPLGLTGGVLGRGGGRASKSLGDLSCMAQTGLFTAGGPPAHPNSLSHLPFLRNSEIFYSFFPQPLQLHHNHPIDNPLSLQFFENTQSPSPSVLLLTQLHPLGACFCPFIWLLVLEDFLKEFLPPGSLPHHSIQS